MNQPKHTPGPWAAYGGISYNSWFKTILAQTEDQRCGFLVADVNGEDRAERDANAHLIAAAPELLSALKLMAIAVEDIRDTELGEMACLDSMAPCEQSLGQLFEAEAKARAAIAKATGEVTPP